jgi:hypothetical protein
LLTVPLYSPLAFNLIIGVLGPAIISERFSSDFAGYLNSGLATLTGIIFSLLIMRLVQSIWLEDAPKRLLKAGWKEIARGKYQTSTRWRTRMAHRIALLTVHTTNECAIDADATASALRDLKIGLSLAELAKLPPLVPAGAQMRLSSILEGASHHYRSMVKGEPNPPSAALLERIDRALHAGTGSTDAVVQRSTTLALVSVRRNIFPQAAPLQ